MNLREQGSAWPVIAVGAIAVLVLIVPAAIRDQRKSSRMATVEAKVQIGDSDPTLTVMNVPRYRWPDTEVPRTAERLRDATAVSIAAMSYVAEQVLRKRAPSSVSVVITGIAQRRLIPSDWIAQQSGTIMLPFGFIQVRYRPSDLSVEVISIPRDGRDGPAILIRLPDDANPDVGVRYFESLQLNGILVPPPFAPISEVIRNGWQPRLFKQTTLPAAERIQLETWARSERLK